MTLAFKNSCDVTVIIPCFNSSSTLQYCISSILNQLLLPKEVIILDDCSNDSELVRRHIDKAIIAAQGAVNFKYRRFSNNKGPGHLRNYGWNLASTKYVAFLDADDFWHPKKLLLQYSFMKDDNSLVLSCHDISNKKIAHDKSLKVTKINFIKLLFRNCIFTSSVMIKREYQERFPTHSKYCEDYSLWLKCSYSRHNMIYLNSCLARQLNEKGDTKRLSKNLKKMHRGVCRELINYLIPTKGFSCIVILAIIFEYFKYLKRVVQTLY